MAPLVSESIPMEVSFIIPAAVISILMLTLLLIKCARHNATRPTALINSHNALDKIEDGQGKIEFPNKLGAIIMDESTQNEIETPINPAHDIKNASMMNLLLSHTPQSSFNNDTGPMQSVSNENILMPPLAKSYCPSPLTTPKNQSLGSIDGAVVLENVNSAHELNSSERRKAGSVSRDNSPSPDYDEVKIVTQKHHTLGYESPKKSPLKTALSAENPTSKNVYIEFNPPELPARNMRLCSFTSSSRPTHGKKQTASNSEEVYESIHDDFMEKDLDTPTSPLSRDGADEDESAYASVDAREMKPTLNPPSLPAPRLPEQAAKPVKEGTLEKKKRNKKRNSFHDKSDTHPLPSEPVESSEAIRKKTKSFTPFNKIRPSKKPQTEVRTSTSPGPFEASGEANVKGFRGALPPLPKNQDSSESDTEEGYSCITATAKPYKPAPSKSSDSSEEGPYSELTYDPTKKTKTTTPNKVEVIAVDYSQVVDETTSPMEIDQPYSSIEEVKGKTLPKSSTLATSTEEAPFSDTELSPRALPQVPVEPKVLVPHQYVKPEEVKRRKAEQRIRKEEEKRLSGVTSTQESHTDVQPDTEPVRTSIPPSQFPSLKSIFSDFRKEEDVVDQNMSMVLGLAPPEPPNDSDDETQSYASAAEVRERKARKPVATPEATTTESAKMKPIQEYEPNSMEVNTASFVEDIGDHTYSSVNDALAEAYPYEEPKSMLQPFTPTYEDPEELVGSFHESEPKSKIEDSPNTDFSSDNFVDRDHGVSQKVSQDLSKLREQKGYVKVSHQKENVPEYASIDDMQKEKLRADSEETDSNVTQATTVAEDSTLSILTLKDESGTTTNEVSI